MLEYYDILKETNGRGPGDFPTGKRRSTRERRQGHAFLFLGG